MSDGMQIIEIGGVKVEVDLRQAKRIETIKVGTRVKVLRKKQEYQSSAVYSGVVVGFEPFPELPTIIVCYVELSYNEAKLNFLSFNAETSGWQLVVAVDDALFESEEVLRLLDRQKAEAEARVKDLEERRAYFERHFGQYWSAIQPAAGARP